MFVIYSRFKSSISDNDKKGALQSNLFENWKTGMKINTPIDRKWKIWFTCLRALGFTYLFCVYAILICYTCLFVSTASLLYISSYFSYSFRRKQ